MTLVKVTLQQRSLPLKINIQVNARKLTKKSMKQTAFLRCFLTQERVLADLTLNRENESTGWHH